MIQNITLDREPPALDPPLLDPQDLEGLAGNPKHPWYWAYAEEAGEWKLNFGKHSGSCLNAIPYSYLKWCMLNVHNRPRLQIAANAYHQGLLNRIDDNYKDFRVLIGKKHRGKRLRECRDKPWMWWLVRWAKHSVRAQVMQNKYDAFLEALQVFLDNPTHQNAHRDIGESLASTEDEDDDDLLNPDEYEDDVDGADDGAEADEYDSQEEVNEDGDLVGTVVPDHVLEFESEREDGLPDDESGAQSTEDEAEQTIDSDDSDEPEAQSTEDEAEQTNSTGEEVEIVAPPQTPRRAKGKSRVVNSPPTTDDDDSPPRTPMRLQRKGSRVINSPPPELDEDEDDVPLSEFKSKRKPFTVGSSKQNHQTPSRSDYTPSRKRKAKPTISTSFSDEDSDCKASPKKRTHHAS